MKCSSDDIILILNDLSINYECTNLEYLEINSFCNLDELKENAITWIKELSEKTLAIILDNPKTLFFCSTDYVDGCLKNVIYIENLKRNFFKIIENIFEDINPDNKIPTIENSAIVLSKNIGENVYIGHGSFVDENVTIGSNVIIMHNVILQGTVEIGDYTFIESGAIVGACGYGLTENGDNESAIIPHLGKVSIGKNVRIGAATCISRGCLCDTIIEDHVKIDNLCHIAHNVVLRKNSKIVACSELSGGVEVGENSWIAPNTSIMQHVKIGENVMGGMASNILRDVPDGALVYGNPAKIKEGR